MYCKKLSKIKVALKDWHFKKYGNIQHKLQLNHTKLLNVESQFQVNPFNFHVEQHLQRLLLQRERLLTFGQKYWGQYARKSWLTQGDRSSRFFHDKMSARKRKSQIFCLQNADDQWVDQPSDITHLFHAEFSKRFTSSISSPRSIALPWILKVISDADNLILTAPFTDDEIKTAFFDMCP